jgi:hypothetical protein
MELTRLVRGISMGELTERDDDIIRVPDRSDRTQYRRVWLRLEPERFYGKFFDANHW